MTLYTATDKKIITKLAAGEQTTTALAQHCNLPLTSALYRLNRLKKTKLVRSRKMGRQVFWSPTKHAFAKPGITQTFVRHEVSHALTCIEKLPKGSVIFAIHGYREAIGDFDWIPTVALKKYHQTLRRKQIIIKGCQSKQTLNLVYSYTDDLLRSHLNRIGSIKVIISKDSMAGFGLIVVSKQFILVTNSRVKRAVVLRDTDIATLLHETFSMFFDVMSELESVKTVNLNELIQQELERRQKDM